MANTRAAAVVETPPRFIRAMKAPAYLGMCRKEFKESVRPHLTEIRIGKQGVAFDRQELDAWADACIQAVAIEKASNEDNNPPRSGRQGVNKWREKQSQASTRGMVSGISTKSSEVGDFKKALDRARGKKQSST